MDNIKEEQVASIIFIGDGKTKYKLSDFNTKNAVEIKLSNDDRKSLLAIFNPKNRRNLGFTLLGIALFIFFVAIIFCVATDIKSVLGALVCQLPSIILLAAGIYILSTTPNIKKSTIKAYEFTITDMMYRFKIGGNMSGLSRYYTKIIMIKPNEVLLYKPKYAAETREHRVLYLRLDENWVMLKKEESYNVIRFGIKTGDKVRCAVLECGKYCYISLY